MPQDIKSWWNPHLLAGVEGVEVTNFWWLIMLLVMMEGRGVILGPLFLDLAADGFLPFIQKVFINPLPWGRQSIMKRCTWTASHANSNIHMTLIIHEMLRKKGKATHHNRKTKQHNKICPRQLFFKEKAASGGTRTHDCPLSSHQLSYRGSSAGLESHIQYKATKAPQPKHHKPDKHVNSKLVCACSTHFPSVLKAEHPISCLCVLYGLARWVAFLFLLASVIYPHFSSCITHWARW